MGPEPQARMDLPPYVVLRDGEKYWPAVAVAPKALPMLRKLQVRRSMKADACYLPSDLKRTTMSKKSGLLGTRSASKVAPFDLTAT